MRGSKPETNPGVAGPVPEEYAKPERPALSTAPVRCRPPRARSALGWWLVAALLAPALAGCANPEEPDDQPGEQVPGEQRSAPPETTVIPLAKVAGWRDELGGIGSEDFFALVELAFDAETAGRAWAENVPDDLPERTGEPVEEGRYGDLAEVNFDTHAVVVWSSGESGSCPQWLSDIDTTGEGRVELTTAEHTQGLACTDDFNAYRMVAAAPLDRLPEPSWLPEDGVSHNGRVLDWGGLVREYPSE